MKNKKKVIGLVAVVLLLITIFAAGYTFARYYKKMQTSAGATIARWSFNSKDENAIINLSSEKIAPGSNGTFEIEVDATNSEVGVDYEILLNKAQNIPANMNFSAKTLDGDRNEISSTTSYDSFGELAPNLSGNIPVGENQKRIIVVSWDWPFNENDETDVDNNAGTLRVENGVSSLESLLNIDIVGRQSR